jgi:hypothetical protein
VATSAGATRPADLITFAHNSERQFARLLDFYRVEWEYEPTAFPIEWDAAGKPTQHFRPDFHLPGWQLYIEITTLNQRLVTKKNRKVRRLRELYPDVRIKVLYQRDYLKLLERYGLEPPSQMVDPAAGGGGRGAGGLGTAGGWISCRRPRGPQRTSAPLRRGFPGDPAGPWSGRGRRGGRGRCPTRRGRCRRCPPTPSWSGWPRCSCRPSAPTAGARRQPGEPADLPALPGRAEPPEGALRGFGGRWFNRRALAGLPARNVDSPRSLQIDK